MALARILLGGGALAKREGKQVHHLHALRQDAVKIDVRGEFSQAGIFRDLAQMVVERVGLDFGRQRVYQVKDAVG